MMRTLDGSMITATDVRRNHLKHNRTNHRYFLRDTSTGNCQGDSFDLVEQVKQLVDYHDENGKFVISDWVWNDVKIIASSKLTSMPNSKNKIGGIGAYGQTFDRMAIVEVL